MKHVYIYNNIFFHKDGWEYCQNILSITWHILNESQNNYLLILGTSPSLILQKLDEFGETHVKRGMLTTRHEPWVHWLLSSLFLLSHICIEGALAAREGWLFFHEWLIYGYWIVVINEYQEDKTKNTTSYLLIYGIKKKKRKFRAISLWKTRVLRRQKYGISFQNNIYLKGNWPIECGKRIEHMTSGDSYDLQLTLMYSF